MVVVSRVKLVLFTDVVGILASNFTPTDRTTLFFWNLNLGLSAEAVFLRTPFHVPIAVEANQMKTVKALVNAGEVSTISEGLRFNQGLIRTKIFEANRTSATDRIVIATHHLS